ncbi:MAG: ABC transporter permease [Lachnospiraceae bacterium]|nr:ABC transporter permease [Lachnospiraceae bacterium]
MKLKEYAKKNQYTVMLLALMAILLLFFTVTKSSTLWMVSTWKSMMTQFPVYGVMTIGVMFCFISGHIDMSFVALGDFACIIGMSYMVNHATEEMGSGQILGIVLVGVLIVLLIGALGGLINGLLITKLNIPPVMATIAMQLVWTGLSIALTEGNTVTGIPTMFTSTLNKVYFGFLPMSVIIFAIVFIIAAFLLKYTTYGEKLYMIGTNKKASHFSAINTDRMIIGTFILCDVICCIGALLMVATMSSAKADYGTSYVMRCILILVLAGVLPDGGMGKILNVLLAIVSIQIIATGVNMFSSLNTYYANMIWGGLLIIVLILSTKLGGNGFARKKKPKIEKKAAA